MKGWQSQLDEAAYWVDPDDIEVSVFGGVTMVAARHLVKYKHMYVREGLGAAHPCMHICRALCQTSWRAPCCGMVRVYLRLAGAKSASLLTATARWESQRRQFVRHTLLQTCVHFTSKGYSPSVPSGLCESLSWRRRCPCSP